MTQLSVPRVMSDAEIDEAEALCAAATPGLDDAAAAPGWCWSKHPELDLYRVERIPSPLGPIVVRRKEDARFIAKSRTLVPRLIAEIRCAQRALADAVAENLAFNVQAGEEIGEARRSRNEALRQLGQWQVDLEKATGRAADSVIASHAERNQLRAERDAAVETSAKLAAALAEALDAWDGFMRRANPAHSDPRDAHARELRKLVTR